MTTTPIPAASPDDGSPAQDVPVHTFRLRPDCTLRLELPDDLTRAEVKRLHLFLKSVVGIAKGVSVLNSLDADWPFSSEDDDLGTEGLDDDWQDKEDDQDAEDNFLIDLDDDSDQDSRIE